MADEGERRAGRKQGKNEWVMLDHSWGDGRRQVQGAVVLVGLRIAF